jgi:glycosyltransferase involved in cell wall biosynthesis
VSPKFSVCIPTHRIDKRLSNTLESLKLLDYPREDYEVCLFINGVDQATVSNCDWVSATTEKLGPSRAKNEAVAMAHHDWVVMLDSDDFLVPSALKQYAAFLQKEPQAVIACEFSMINYIEFGNGKIACYPPSTEDYRSFYQQAISNLAQTAACGHPTLVKKSEFVPFDAAFPFAEERKLMLDYWKQNKAVHLMGTCTYIYNWNETGATDGIPLSRLAPEKQNHFRQFTNAVILAEKEPRYCETTDFYVPDDNDRLAIQKFLEWENQSHDGHSNHSI